MGCMGRLGSLGGSFWSLFGSFRSSVFRIVLRCMGRFGVFWGSFWILFGSFWGLFRSFVLYGSLGVYDSFLGLLRSSEGSIT